MLLIPCVSLGYKASELPKGVQHGTAAEEEWGEGGDVSRSGPWASALLFYKNAKKIDRVSLCTPSCPGTLLVCQAGLKLRGPLATASQVLELKGVLPLAGTHYMS